MAQKSKDGLRNRMQTSPWIILGSTVILLVVVMVLAFQNTNREKRFMSEILSAKGAALIRAVEAGARTGMTGMMWGGKQIQQLLEETARLPDVLYMAVINQNGQAVAHSDPSKINAPFDNGRKITHLGPHEHENWELVTASSQQRVFEVHRHFRPLAFSQMDTGGQMQSMMQKHIRISDSPNDWFAPENRKQLLIIVGLDVTPFEEAIRSDIRTTVVLSVVMLLLGFAGFVSLFWMHTYRVTRRSLRDTSAFADEVVSHLPVGLIATDRSGRITFFNAAAEKITNLKKSLVQHKKPDSFLPQGLFDVQESLDKEAKIMEREVECTFAGNKTVPVGITATHINNDQEEFVGQVLILRDLSEIRRLQDEIRRQEKLAAVGGLAAGVAHEVRNPLSSIKTLATFLAGQFSDGSQGYEATTVMVQEVDRLNRTITELLEFARPSDLRVNTCDIKLLINHTIRLVHQDALNKNIDIKQHTDDGICPVWADPDRLAQCLLNLFINAIQAMEGGGTLTVRSAAGREGYVTVTVSDTGPGIAPEHLTKIFDPYFTTKKKGTGLGLPIVYKIIEAHHGKLDVKSTLNQGTSFTMTIPCNQPGPGGRQS